MKHIAKLSRNGRSQSVRLPSEFRFQGKEVFIRRDSSTGDVILSRRPDSWESFFELIREIGVPKDFLSNRGEGATTNQILHRVPRRMRRTANS